MDLVANRHDKIVVRDQIILVSVEVIEDLVCLLAGDREPPVLQEKLEFFLLNVWVVVFVEVPEGLPDRFPLLTDLVDELHHNVSFAHQVLCRITLQLWVLNVLELLVVRVLFGVVPEVEPLCHVDRVPEPLAEV